MKCVADTGGALFRATNLRPAILKIWKLIYLMTLKECVTHNVIQRPCSRGRDTQYGSQPPARIGWKTQLRAD